MHRWPPKADPEPQLIRDYVFRQERYDGDWPPEDAPGFLAWFQDYIDSVPDERRDTLRIELSSESGYEGSHYASIEISYTRPETPEEVFIRLAKRTELVAQNEREELAALAALKAKYEQR